MEKKLERRLMADWVSWLQRQLADVHKNLKSPVTGIEKMG
jgi:hypothetical protein